MKKQPEVKSGFLLEQIIGQISGDSACLETARDATAIRLEKFFWQCLQVLEN